MVFRLNTVEAGLVLSRLVFLVFALSASLLFAPPEAPSRGALGLLPSSKTGVFFVPPGAVPLEDGGPALGETPGMLLRETPERLADAMTGPRVFDVARALEYEDAGALIFTEAGSAAFETSPADSGWSWPCNGPTRVLRAYDPPARPWLAGHRGVDLDLPPGSIIRAPAAGTVLVAGTIVDRPVISIQHGRLRSTFEAVEPLVLPGQFVARGEAIGVLGEGSHTPGLHWGAKLSATEYVDPLRLLIGEVVLLPWEG